MILLLPTADIFALLILCFAGLAVMQQIWTDNQIEEKCNNFMTFSGPAILHRISLGLKCYVSFNSVTYGEAKHHCKQHVPVGLQGRLFALYADNYGDKAFRALTKLCNNKLDYYWMDQITLPDKTYPICEQACELEDGSVKPLSKPSEEACLINQRRKFICEYARECTTQIGDVNWKGYLYEGYRSFTCKIGNRNGVALCHAEYSWYVYWYDGGKISKKDIGGTCPIGATPTTAAVRATTTKAAADTDDSSIPVLVIVVAVMLLLFGASVIGAIITFMVWTKRNKQKVKPEENKNDEWTIKAPEILD